MLQRFRRARGHDSQEGAILVLTLAFLLLFGLFISALLGQVGANFKTTDVVRSRDSKNLNADAGIEYGLMRVQQDATLCPDTGAGPQPITPTFLANGTQAVTVTCQALSGAATGVSGYAAVLLHSTSSPLDSSNGQAKVIEGGLWAGTGLTLGKALNVKDGDVDIHSSTGCPAQPGNLTVSPSPPYAYGCVPGVAPDPPHALPARPAAAPAFTDMGACRVFKPGVYTTPPILKNKNYFTSGVYVFKGIGDWSTDKKDIYGGAQATGENVEVTGGAPCKTDADAGAAGNGTGVEFIFEGNSTLDIGNQGLLELFARRPPAPDGTAGISLYAVPPGTPGWATWSSSSGKALLNVAGGSTPLMSIHGTVYAPSAAVELFAANTSSAVLLAGIVADTLLMKSSASASGLIISTRVGPGSRTLLLTATAPGPDPAERPTTAYAVVQIGNDAARTVNVLSRRVAS